MNHHRGNPTLGATRLHSRHPRWAGRSRSWPPTGGHRRRRPAHCAGGGPAPGAEAQPALPTVALPSALPTPARRRRDSRPVVEPRDGGELSSLRPASYPARLRSAGPGDGGSICPSDGQRCGARSTRLCGRPVKAARLWRSFFRRSLSGKLQPTVSTAPGHPKPPAPGGLRRTARGPVSGSSRCPSGLTDKPPHSAPPRPGKPLPRPLPRRHLPPPVSRSGARRGERRRRGNGRERAREGERERGAGSPLPPSLPPSFLPPLPPSLAPSPLPPLSPPLSPPRSRSPRSSSLLHTRSSPLPAPPRSHSLFRGGRSPSMSAVCWSVTALSRPSPLRSVPGARQERPPATCPAGSRANPGRSNVSFRRGAPSNALLFTSRSGGGTELAAGSAGSGAPELCRELRSGEGAEGWSRSARGDPPLALPFCAPLEPPVPPPRLFELRVWARDRSRFALQVELSAGGAARALGGHGAARQLCASAVRAAPRRSRVLYGERRRRGSSRGQRRAVRGPARAPWPRRPRSPRARPAAPGLLRGPVARNRCVRAGGRSERSCAWRGSWLTSRLWRTAVPTFWTFL